MLFEGAQLCTGRDIPQPDRVVVTTAGEILPVSAEGDRADRTGMNFESAQLCAGRNLPQLRRGVSTPAGESFPVRTEGD